MKKLTKLDKSMVEFLLKQQEQFKMEIADLDAKLAEHEKVHGQDAEYNRLHHKRHMRQSYQLDGLAMIRDLLE